MKGDKKTVIGWIDLHVEIKKSLQFDRDNDRLFTAIITKYKRNWKYVGGSCGFIDYQAVKKVKITIEEL